MSVLVIHEKIDNGFDNLVAALNDKKVDYHFLPLDLLQHYCFNDVNSLKMYNAFVFAGRIPCDTNGHPYPSDPFVAAYLAGSRVLGNDFKGLLYATSAENVPLGNISVHTDAKDMAAAI